jgi:hypothetical protein
MIVFLIDEDMPRSTARVLKARGFDALDVRDSGMRGKSDEDINRGFISFRIYLSGYSLKFKTRRFRYN